MQDNHAVNPGASIHAAAPVAAAEEPAPRRSALTGGLGAQGRSRGSAVGVNTVMIVTLRVLSMGVSQQKAPFH